MLCSVPFPDTLATTTIVFSKYQTYSAKLFKRPRAFLYFIRLRIKVWGRKRQKWNSLQPKIIKEIFLSLWELGVTFFNKKNTYSGIIYYRSAIRGRVLITGNMTRNKRFLFFIWKSPLYLVTYPFPDNLNVQKTFLEHLNRIW